MKKQFAMDANEVEEQPREEINRKEAPVNAGPAHITWDGYTWIVLSSRRRTYFFTTDLKIAAELVFSGKYKSLTSVRIVDVEYFRFVLDIAGYTERFRNTVD